MAARQVFLDILIDYSCCKDQQVDALVLISPISLFLLIPSIHGTGHAIQAILFLAFLTKNSMLTMPHPPYSPDLAPNDFFLFPSVEAWILTRLARTSV
ncbi:hypothetical protein LAZ67_2004874 [Cordylochernes scorpioides]|uniref:Transposase n=1 Tax=Cordylochernes scorpioides TaxID=51811 RepID=A0ABY6K5J2_9ARAC|nr:hypothetical protein LAZ67_2004874 [Cordylochernes scorpioides]